MPGQDPLLLGDTNLTACDALASPSVAMRLLAPRTCGGSLTRSAGTVVVSEMVSGAAPAKDTVASVTFQGKRRQVTGGMW